jgi:hypothetical protein
MDPTTVYATAAGGISLSLFLFRISSHLLHLAGNLLRLTSLLFAEILNSILLLLAKHLTYPFFLQRHGSFGPWTRGAVLLHSIYAASNLFCISFPAVSLTEIAQRSGNLSLINLIVSIGSGCFDLCTDVFGISRHVCHQVHRATAWMTTILLTTHAIASLLNSSQTEVTGLTVRPSPS